MIRQHKRGDTFYEVEWVVGRDSPPDGAEPSIDDIIYGQKYFKDKKSARVFAETRPSDLNDVTICEVYWETYDMDDYGAGYYETTDNVEYL